MTLQNTTNRFPESLADLPSDLLLELRQRSRVLLRSNTASLTNTLQETTLFAGTIQSSEYGDNAIFEIYALFTMTNNANAKGFAVKFNNVNVIERSITSNSTLQVVKYLFARNSKNSLVASATTDTGISGANIIGANKPNIDFSSNLNFSITGKLNVITDSIILEASFLRVTH